MLCSHEKKFIYLKTRKTAGTSVEIFFERFCLPPGQFSETHRTNQIITHAGIVGARGQWLVRPQFYNHMSASEVRNILGREIFDSYFKFCTMRNPFDKIVSQFWYWIPPDFSTEPFSKIKRRFTDYVSHNFTFGGFTFGGFSDRDIFMIDGHSVIDEFIRYEHLTTDVEQVCKALGIEDHSVKLLGNYKSGFRKRQEHFSEYYDPWTKGLVERELAWELNRFGYSL